MGFVRDHAGYHQCFAEMHGRMILPIADRVANRHGLGSLHRCLDRSQTEIEERPQASKAPARYPRRRQWMRLEHCGSIVANVKQARSSLICYEIQTTQRYASISVAISAPRHDVNRIPLNACAFARALAASQLCFLQAPAFLSAGA